MKAVRLTAFFLRARSFSRDIGLSMSTRRSALTPSRQECRRRRVPVERP
jgi:hypothetical protein